VDDDGYIVITDRKKDMILVGGFNVYPREVEDILFPPQGGLVAVIGVPDEKSGEIRQGLHVQLNPGQTADEEEILAWCRERLAGYKRPKAVEFRDSVPVSNVGKVLRRVPRGGFDLAGTSSPQAGWTGF
jgi:long-chain acyl-CoA synthetase